MTDLKKQYINVPKINVPFTTIQNRAQIPDLTQDLGVRMGVERIMTQSIYKITDEYGPNGETVYGVEGDDLGLIRLIGNWTIKRDTYGSSLAPHINPEGYLEITFYGTGLNCLALTYPNQRLMTVKVDNVTYPNVDWQYSNVLGLRKYSKNVIQNLVSGLPLGIHTAVIGYTPGGSAEIFGFEILNESSQITVNPGESRVNDAIISTLSQNNLSYNSGFESGTLGTKGGRVAVYQKIDGTIAHAVTPVDATAKYLANADHTNEEVAREYNFREFGAGRNDDFSTLPGTSSSRAFTLDDNTTTLVGAGVNSGFNTLINENVLSISANGNYFVLTFIGTGIDIAQTIEGSGGNFTYEYFIDGVSVGTYTQNPTVAGSGIFKVASGLEYGTHTLKVVRNSAVTYGIIFNNFIVYQPKTPTIPTNAQLLGTYNILANYVADTSGTNLQTISKGVIRKTDTREYLYSGTWIASGVAPNTRRSGTEVTSNTNGSYFEYTFFGTGFDYLWAAHPNRTTNASVYIDGVLLTSANFPSVSVQSYGITNPYDFVNGILNQTHATPENPAGLLVTGLSLGKHTIKVVNNTTGYLMAGVIDVHTPIYSPVQAVRNKQNTLSIGNNSIADHRKFTELDNIVKKVNYTEAVAVDISPTTTSTVYIPIPDMLCTIHTETGEIEISFKTVVTGLGPAAANSAFFSIYVDGKDVTGNAISIRSTNTIGHHGTISLNLIVPVNKGFHTIQAFWKVDSQTFRLDGTFRNLIVKEL